MACIGGGSEGGKMISRQVLEEPTTRGGVKCGEWGVEVTPRLLAWAAGCIEVPFTEMPMTGGASRQGARVNCLISLRTTGHAFHDQWLLLLISVTCVKFGSLVDPEDRSESPLSKQC